MPTAAERAGDFSNTLDNLGARYNFIKDPNLAGGCSATDTSGCFADGGVIGKIPANRLYQTGLNILNQYPLPNVSVAGRGLQLRDHPAQGEPRSAPSRRCASTTSRPRSCARRSSTPGWIQRRDQIPGLLPGFNDTQMQRPVISTLAISSQLQPEQHAVPRRHVRPQPERAGRLRARAERHRADLLPRRGADERQLEPLQRRPRRPAAAVPGRQQAQSRLLRDEGAGRDESGAAGVGQRRLRQAAGVRLGQPHQSDNAPPNIPFPTYFNVNATQDVAISLTKVAGRHTLKTGFFNTHSYKAEQATGADSFGTLNFAAGRGGDQRLRHVVRLRQCGHRVVQLVSAGLEVHRRQLRLRQPRGLHPGQLEGQQPPDARLRHALRQRVAAVRQAGAGQQLPARSVVALGRTGPVSPGLRGHRCRRAPPVRPPVSRR